MSSSDCRSLLNPWGAPQKTRSRSSTVDVTAISSHWSRLKSAMTQPVGSAFRKDGHPPTPIESFGTTVVDNQVYWILRGEGLEGTQDQIQVAISIQVSDVARAKVVLTQYGPTPIQIEATLRTPEDIGSQAGVGTSCLAAMSRVESDEVYESVCVEIGCTRLITASEGNIPAAVSLEAPGSTPVDVERHLFVDGPPGSIAEDDSSRKSTLGRHHHRMGCAHRPNTLGQLFELPVPAAQKDARLGPETFLSLKDSYCQVLLAIPVEVSDPGRRRLRHLECSGSLGGESGIIAPENPNQAVVVCAGARYFTSTGPSEGQVAEDQVELLIPVQVAHGQV